MFGYIWEYVYTSFLRYWLKWLIRQVTGTCELQRICSGHKPGAARTTKAEYSLQSSKNKVLRGALETTKDSLEQCVDQIMKVKNIKPAKDPKFKESLHICLLQITGYSSLYISVEDLRKEVFSSDNPEHEAMLLKLWDLLMPTVKLESRITKQWGDIGFQGEDPKTDFRGMGLLGLINLVCEWALCRRYRMASSTPTPALYANCSGSWACCTCGRRRLRKSRSRVFIRCDVSATGRKSFSSLGRFLLGTGTMQDVFHRAGTLPSRRLRLKTRCSGSPSSAAHALSILGHTLSGPAAFLGRSFLYSFYLESSSFYKVHFWFWPRFMLKNSV
uniref:ELMO domain-containing protein n=1 Tax=Astatotilapia calliptera TaxID=8154 RepID=A0A3P8R1T6_ASTCA